MMSGILSHREMGSFHTEIKMDKVLLVMPLNAVKISVRSNLDFILSLHLRDSVHHDAQVQYK